MIYKKYFCILFLYFATIFSINAKCLAEDHMVYKRISDVPGEKWTALAGKRIFFGHQSVGFNIVDGIVQVMSKHPEIRLNILETRNTRIDVGSFAHFRVGENLTPVSKIKDFINIVDQEPSMVFDVAALKLCYVDAQGDIDIVEVFKQYQDAIFSVRIKHPTLVIVHFTMPLKTQGISWKTRAKLLFGKKAWEFKDNIKRNEFNKLLIDTYNGREPIFDIARFEATSLGGTVSNFKYQGSEYLSMNPEYSDDGGHLNKRGSGVIAEEFLLFLVNTL